MPDFGASRHLIVQGDARRIPLPDRSVHCVATSPPYFNLRNYKVLGQIGLEKTPKEYIAELMLAFAEVWRVLRDDGTLWLNIGDSYSSGGRGGNSRKSSTFHGNGHREEMAGIKKTTIGLNPKNLIGIPWMLAFALRDAGWYLRSEIIWHKPNGMTESAKDRPMKAHDQVFLLSKKLRYFYDGEAVKTKTSPKTFTVNTMPRKGDGTGSTGEKLNSWMSGNGGRQHPEMSNLRTVWKIATKSFPGAHFATFPVKLVIPMILAGTSEKGCCPSCGSPRSRLTTKERVRTRPGLNSKCYDRETGGELPPNDKPWGRAEVGNRDPGRHITRSVTVGWNPTCRCGIVERAPCVVLDPFSGAGTVPLVAENLGRVGVGLELSRDYCLMSEDRISRPHRPRRLRRASDEVALPLDGPGTKGGD